METYELYKLRCELDMTQAEIAQKLGMSQSHYSNLEVGNKRIFPHHIEKIKQLRRIK